ncbi:MAG: hypothetical protein ACREV1_00315 [Gammaproteobacteria bacterium]
MLTFESPFYEIKGVVLFRDHRVSTLFHYLAGPPRLTRGPDGKPNLLLLKYRHALEAMAGANPRVREQLGGAFLLLGVDCGISEATKDDIKRELEARLPPDSGPVSLVPVLYTKGTVSIIALDAQQAAAEEPQGDAAAHSTFVRGVRGSATPSLLQDQRAIFSIALNTDAATLIEDAYQSELSPIGVMYELEFSGLRPALAVKATVDYKRVYDQLKLGLHIGVGKGKPPAQEPTPAPAPVPAPAPAPATPAPAQGAAPAKETTPAQGPGSGQKSNTQIAISADLSYAVEHLKQTGAIKIEIVRQQEGQSVDQMEKNALELLKEDILKDLFKPAMTNTPATPSPAASAAAAAAAAQGFIAPSEKTNQGKTGSGASVEIGFQLQYKKEEELKTISYDYSVIAPEKRIHAPNGFFSALIGATEKAQHLREINLDDPFFKTLDVDVSTTADFPVLDLKSLVVDLQYGGTIESPRVPGTAVFTPEQNQPRHFQAFLDGDDYSYRYRAHYLFGQAAAIASQHQGYQSPWRTLTTRALVVHPPEDVAMLRVFIEPGVVEWDLIQTIEAKLSYEDLENAFRTERTFLISSNTPRQEWIVRLSNPALTTYQVHYRWHLKDQTEIEAGPERHDETQLFVRDPFVDRLPILIDPRVDPNHTARIHVELFYDDTANRWQVRKPVDLDGPNFRSTTVTLPIIDPRRREYTYTVSLIRPNGSDEVYAPKQTEQLSIIVTEGGIYLDVDIVLLGDLAQLGVDALQIDLRTKPLEGELERVEDHLFQPGPEKKITKRLLLRADQPQRFEYRTTVFTPTRAPIVSDWTRHESSILALQVRPLLEP